MGPTEAGPEVTRDTFWHGRLAVWQPARGHGYRFNLDPVVLAGFCPAASSVVELGAGCGILSLLLLASGKARQVMAVEVQPALAALMRRNALENGLQQRMQVVEADVRHVDAPPADLVVFNPPYFRAEEGRASPHPGRDAARRERYGTLEDFVACARRLMTPGGVVAAVVPVARAAELRRLCELAGLFLGATRDVVARAGAPAHLVLSSFVRDAEVRCRAMPPLQMHADAGRDFSPDVAPWVSGSVVSATGLSP